MIESSLTSCPTFSPACLSCPAPPPLGTYSSSFLAPPSLSFDLLDVNQSVIYGHRITARTKEPIPPPILSDQHLPAPTHPLLSCLFCCLSAHQFLIFQRPFTILVLLSLLLFECLHDGCDRIWRHDRRYQFLLITSDCNSCPPVSNTVIMTSCRVCARR